MTKELLNQFEDLELFTENVENALERARQKTEYPLDLRLYVGNGQHDIFCTFGCVADYLEMFEDAKKRLIETNGWQDETFIDIYENTPAEAVYCGVTIWLNYVDGRVLTRVES